MSSTDQHIYYSNGDNNAGVMVLLIIFILPVAGIVVGLILRFIKNTLGGARTSYYNPINIIDF